MSSDASASPQSSSGSSAAAVVTTSPHKMNWSFFLVGVMVFTVAMMLVSFPVGLYTVFATPLSGNYSASTPVHALTYDLFFVSVEVPVVGNLGDIFVLFSAVYFVFLFLAARQGTGLLKALRAAASNGYEAFFTNPLAATLILLGATSLVTLVVDTVQTSAGVSTGSLTGDPFALLVDFTLAPLLEESTFRLIMIGVPVLLLALVLLRNFSPTEIARVLWRPSSVWDVDETEEEGGKMAGAAAGSFERSGPSIFPDRRSDSLKVRAMKPVVYVFLVLSSFMFGYAHYASGAGWGPGKISEAALAGLALGYLYIKYGFHTDVLLHWSINYVGSIFSFFAQGVWGVPWTSNTGNVLDVIPTLDIIFFLGLPSTLIVADQLLRRVRGRSSQGKSASALEATSVSDRMVVRTRLMADKEVRLENA